MLLKNWREVLERVPMRATEHRRRAPLEVEKVHAEQCPVQILTSYRAAQTTTLVVSSPSTYTQISR